MSIAAAVFFAIGIAVGAVLARTAVPATAPVPPVTAGVPGVGPSEVVQGIPIGYRHTSRGAAQAAGNYLAALGALLDPAQVRTALDVVAEPAYQDRLEKALDASLEVEEGVWGIQTAVQFGQPVILTQTPIAYRVDDYTSEQATVRVWLVTNVAVANRQRLTALFGITSATLAWVGGDWRLRAADAGSQSTDVVPACLQSPTPTGGVPSMLDGFVPYGR